MGIEDIKVDFDIDQIIEGIRDSLFKTVRIVFNLIFGLPISVKITIAILFVLSVIGISYLTWKYRDEWRYVKY